MRRLDGVGVAEAAALVGARVTPQTYGRLCGYATMIEVHAGLAVGAVHGNQKQRLERREQTIRDHPEMVGIYTQAQMES